MACQQKSKVDEIEFLFSCIFLSILIPGLSVFFASQSVEGWNPFRDPLLAFLLFQAFYALFIFPFHLGVAKGAKAGHIFKRDFGRALLITLLMALFSCVLFRFSELSHESAMQGAILVALLYASTLVLESLLGFRKYWIPLAVLFSFVLPLAGYGLREFAGKDAAFLSSCSPFVILCRFSRVENETLLWNFILFLASCTILAGIWKVLAGLVRARPLCIVFLIVFLFPAESSSGEEVESLFHGAFKEGRIFPIHISGDGGTVEVLQGEEYVLKSAYSSGTSILYPFIADQHQALRLRIRDEEILLPFSMKKIPRKDAVIGIFDERGECDLPEAIPGATLISLSSIPPLWQGLEMLDILILTRASNESLSPKAVDSFEAWVAGGGTLIFFRPDIGTMKMTEGSIFKSLRGDPEKEDLFGLGRCLTFFESENLWREMPSLVGKARRDIKMAAHLMESATLFFSLSSLIGRCPMPLALFFIGALVTGLLVLGLKSLRVIRKRGSLMALVLILILGGGWMLVWGSRSSVRGVHLPIVMGRLGKRGLKRIDLFYFQPYRRGESVELFLPGQRLVKEVALKRERSGLLEIEVQEGTGAKVTLTCGQMGGRCIAVESVFGGEGMGVARQEKGIKFISKLGIGLQEGQFFEPRGGLRTGFVPSGGESALQRLDPGFSLEKAGPELFRSGTGSLRVGGAILRELNRWRGREVFLATGVLPRERGLTCNAISLESLPALFLFFSERDG